MARRTRFRNLPHVPEIKANLFVCLLQVRNSKASGYCLDQGAEDDDKAILYPCHGMSSQVGAPGQTRLFRLALSAL